MGRFAPRPKVGPIGQRAPLAHPQSIRYEEQPMHHKRCKFQVKIQQTFEWPQLVGSEEECSLRINNPFFWLVLSSSVDGAQMAAAPIC